MKTAVAIVLLTVAVCQATTDFSKNPTKVLHNGMCYRNKDCTYPFRPSVEAAECCNIFRGCSYFEPANNQCYFCNITECDNDDHKYKCYKDSNCDTYDQSVTDPSKCCNGGDCSYSYNSQCYKCGTKSCGKPAVMGRCYRNTDCTKFFRFSVEAAECCNVYKGCSYYEPENKQCYFCKIPGCSIKTGNPM